MLRLIVFVLLVATLGWQTEVSAQNKVARVGVLTIDVATKKPLADWVEIFRRTLAQQGWIEGKTITFVMRHAGGNSAKFGQAAAELVKQRVDLIFVNSAPGLRAAAAATNSVPIIGVDYTNDPVTAGYAKSYGRPSGNVTGVFLDAPQFATKLLELMREIVPDLKHVAALWDPSPGDTHVKALTSAAASLGIQVQVVQVSKPEDIDNAGAALNAKPQAVVIVPSPMLYVENARLTNLAAQQRLPFVSMAPYFPEAGGLLGYGPNDGWTIERCAFLAARVLRGTKAGDLPIERPIKFDLIVNLKTAKALNIKLPESVLTRAERVIR